MFDVFRAEFCDFQANFCIFPSKKSIFGEFLEVCGSRYGGHFRKIDGGEVPFGPDGGAQPKNQHLLGEKNDPKSTNFSRGVRDFSRSSNDMISKKNFAL